MNVGSDEARRRVQFALAVGVLIVAVIAMTIVDPGGDTGDPHLGMPTGQSRGPALEKPPVPLRGKEGRAAALSAERFVQAYLRYQEGHLRGRDRSALLRYSTPDLGGQLLRAPVRLPPGSRFPRQFVARIADLEAGLFDGSPAFLVALVVAGKTGTHLLSVSLIEQGRGWVVAGIGP
jgi:hypothetical protein